MQSKLIRNRDKAAQLLAFDGMTYGRCRPTDIDASMDWQQRTFIFVEIKTEGVALTVGQRIHLEGLVKAIKAGGKEAYAILACHQTRTKDDVHVAICRTDRVFNGNTWDIVDTNERLFVTLDGLYQEHLNEVQI
jgi:hypothetical protein